MKRSHVILLATLAVVMALIIMLLLYFKYHTVYLQYNPEQYAGHDIAYIGLGEGIKLKGYPEIGEGVMIRGQLKKQTIITDKQTIKKIFDYVNSIPLKHAAEDAGLKNITRKEAVIDFYNKDNINIGWLSFRGEQYISTSLYPKDVYRVRDKGTQIVVGLEELDLS